MKIVVLAGGLSPERDVSLSSGVMAANALIDRGHQVILADLFMGLDAIPDDPALLFLTAGRPTPYSVSLHAPDLAAVRSSRVSGLSSTIGNGIVELCKTADITYLALHGGDGENGRLQAFLDLNDVKYTGSPSFGCAVAMDKWVTKQLLLAAGVKTPNGFLLHKGGSIPFHKFPCVVKPCCGGSSLGITIPQNETEFQASLKEAFLLEDAVLVEEYISGRELTCGILGERPLPPTEIIPHDGFYDYAHKYQPGWTDEITPARIPCDITEEIQRLTKIVYHTLHLEAYARVDFLLTEAGELYCLEANTLPGMTPTSLLPQGAAEIGIDYPSLCEQIINLSLRKYI